METSILATLIKNSSTLPNRVIAIVQADRWNTEGAPVADFIDVDNIMWAVATNTTVQANVLAALAADPELSLSQATDLITDSDLSYIVLSVAIPRLAGS